MSSDKTKRLTDELCRWLRPDEWVTAREVVVRGCEGRPDVVAVRRRQYLRKEIRTYEVKISRSDFLSDVGSMKWRKYLSFSHRVYFAAPAGILKKGDIPSDAGLVVFGDSGWSTVKAARGHTPEGLDADAVLSILFSLKDEQLRIRDLRERGCHESNAGVAGLAKRLGSEMSRRISGCVPRVEASVQKVLDVVMDEFGDPSLAVPAIRFAAGLVRERDTILSMSRFLERLGGLRGAPIDGVKSRLIKDLSSLDG